MWGIEFQYPLRLFLIVPILILFLVRRKGWYWLGFNVMRAAPVGFVKKAVIMSGKFFFFSTFIFAILAFAGPFKGREEKDEKAKVHQACLALDMSGSMFSAVSSEIKEARITVATDAGKKFVDTRPGDMFALVPFDAKARLGLALPFTTDRDIVKKQLDIIAASKEGGSTAIGEGIWTCNIFLIRANAPKNLRLDARELRRALENSEDKGFGSYAFKTIRETGGMNHAFITVLTDGENNTGINPQRALMFAARVGIKVYIIAATPERFPELIRAVESTGGRYFFAKSVTESQRFYEIIDKLEKKEIVVEKRIKPKSQHWYFIAASAVSLFFTTLSKTLVVKVP